MISYNRILLLIIITFSLFSTTFAFESTGNLILNGNFDQLETKNVLDIVVFIVITTLIVSILEQSLAKHLPIPAKTFRLIVVLFLISYFWILLSSFGGDALVFVLVWISLIGVVAISVVVWNLIRQSNPLLSSRSIYGMLAGYVTFVILISAVSNLKAQGFEDSTLMNAILLLSFGGVSSGNIGALIVFVVLGVLGIILTRSVPNTSIENEKDVHSSISKHVKSETQQRTDFNRHYQALYDGINQLNKISYGKDQSTLDEQTQEQQRSIVGLLHRELQELIKIASTEMKKTQKKNLGFSLNSVETNMYNNQQLIKYLSQMEVIMNRLNKMNPLQINSQELENVNQLYAETNNVISRIDKSIEQDLKNYSAIDQFIDKLKSEHLHPFESVLSDKKLKEFKNQSKPQILQIIMDKLVSSQDIDSVFQTIDESLRGMVSYYPVQSAQQSQIKVEKIKTLNDAFKSSLSSNDSNENQKFWYNYWNSNQTSLFSNK